MDSKPAANQCSVHTIVGEVQSVIATMRNNTRFSALSARESPLLREFKQLRSKLRPSTDITELDPMIYLKPFLNVIHSEETSGPITGAALTSVDKFLTYGFLRDSPQTAKAMKKIADTVVHCRFEATCLEGDDVILMKILRVIISCLTCSAGALLSDDNVFEMVTISFRMSRGRLSELLKKTAERSLTEIVHVLFLVHNIHKKVYFAEDNFLFLQSDSESVLPPPSPVTQKATTTNLEDSSDYINPRGVRFQRADTSSNPNVNEMSGEGPCLTTFSPGEFIPKPYGVGCVIKVFKFLVELTSPHDETIPESLKQISIQLLNTIVETQPQLIEKNPALLELLCNQLCKCMLQNLQTDNLDRLNLTMRLFFNLHISLRKHLKMQFEVFFNNLLMFLLKNSQFVSFEKQEIVLENLVQFFYQPNFTTDIFANYDCHTHCTNTLEQLIMFLYKSAFPLNGSLYSIQYLSLECLLALLETISLRCDGSFIVQNETIDPDTAQLLRQRASKKQLLAAADVFNKKASHGITFLQENHLLPENPSDEAIASFLRDGPGLDKNSVGEYLAKQSKAFVQAYVATFDFKGMDYVTSLRMFLTSFVLSGEAQVIDRIVEAFAHHWFASNPQNIFATPDVPYVLCFSIVMLNVDAHNDGVKTKMTEEEYVHRLYGVNDGKDLPSAFLKDVYRKITQNEIKIVDDTPSQSITDPFWNALLLRGARIGPFASADVHTLDRDIFLLVSRAIIASLSVVFDTTTETEVLQTVLKGFTDCSIIARYFHLSASFDNVIVNLCKYTGLLRKSKASQYAASTTKRLILFGSDKKAQLATITTFQLVLQYGDNLREGWMNIVRCISSLHEMELIDHIIEEDSLEGKRRSNKKIVKEKEAYTGSLFSYFLWGSSDSVEEESDPVDIEIENAARQTVSSCSIPSIIETSCELKSESLVFLIKALIRDSSPSSASFSEGNASFCLDLLTKITLMNHKRIKFVWVLVSKHFANIVQLAKAPSEFVEKAIVCLLLLCVKLAPKEEVATNMYGTLELFLSLEPSVADAMSESIIIAVARLLDANVTLPGAPVPWKVILALIQQCATSSVAQERGFNTLLTLLPAHTNPPHTKQLALHPDAFQPYLRAIMAYINIPVTYHGNNGEGNGKEGEVPVPIPVRAMNILSDVLEASGTCATLETVWGIYWLPIFQIWIQLCRDSRNYIRVHAMTLLQRQLLSSSFAALSPARIRICFEDVMFPLLDHLLVPCGEEGGNAQSLQMEETRVRAQQLLAKSLLQYLHQLTQLSDFHSTIWPKILYVIEQYMKADCHGLLAEAIPEVLKNILLVMLQMNVFHASNTIGGQDIWTVSWMTIDGFCPSLKEDDSFRASLSAFQRVPASSKVETEKATQMIHSLATRQTKTTSTTPPTSESSQKSVTSHGKDDLPSNRPAPLLPIT